MAYEKQTWETGQVITADKLNHMEDGIAAGGALIGHAVLSQQSDEEYPFKVDEIDITYANIVAASEQGIPCMIQVKLPLAYPGAPQNYAWLYQGELAQLGGAVEFFGVIVNNFSYIYRLTISSSMGALKLQQCIKIV